MIGKTIDGLNAGDHAELTRVVAGEDIAGFVSAVGDYNPVHTDEVYARQTEFGGRIAHGPMIIGLAFGLASRLDLIDGTVVARFSITRITACSVSSARTGA